jgi:RHS repeat-associated protein
MTLVQDNPDSITYATSATYAPQGALGSVQNSASTVSTLFYNNRLETCRISVKNTGTPPANCTSSTTGNVLDLSYSYAQSSHNNGNIASQTNNGASGRTQTYTYDTLNRLLTAQAAATTGADCWGQSFGNNATPPTLAADALNNLLNINATKCSSPSLSVSGSTSTNQFTSTGYSYDSAGNNTADALYTYTYDAENRIRSANVLGATYCYTYDGDGLRVMKAHGSNCSSVTVDMLYWRSIYGDTIAETDGGGSTTNASYHEYVFFAGRRIAQSNPSSGSVYYYFADHLGSTRVVTNASDSLCYEADFLPYGTENTPSGFSNTCSTNYKFTGYERDGETGLDYAFARYYNQRMGRFMSGDPLAGEGNDPQTLNRYSSVRNNSVNLVDPSGMLPT